MYVLQRMHRHRNMWSRKGVLPQMPRGPKQPHQWERAGGWLEDNTEDTLAILILESKDFK